MSNLIGASVSVVLCGPDEASRQTAEFVSQAVGNPPIKAMDELTEMDMGLWEGLTPAEAEKKFPSAFRQWIEEPTAVIPPQGETVAEAQERLVDGLSRTLTRSKEGQAVAIVLRPVALSLVRCWLGGGTTCRLWSTLDERPPVEWCSIPRSRLATKRERARS